MPVPHLKDLSPLAQSAVGLDIDFAELERLGGELQTVDVETDFGLERAKKLLGRFGECGQRIGDGVQLLAKELEQARANAERIAGAVAGRAVAVQNRQREEAALLQRFEALGKMARSITEDVGRLPKPSAEEFSGEQRAHLLAHLPTIHSQFDVLVDEAAKLRDDSKRLKMRALERDAHALSQNLAAARKRLSSLAESPEP